MAELTEQQTHLQSVIDQQNTLAQEVQQLNNAPVSYTHLTLPTT